MPNYQLPENPTASRFGYPLALRQEEFTKLSTAADLPTHRVVFKGTTNDFPILKVSVNLPKYRLSNGRTASAQEEYLAKHPERPRNLFEQDPELLEVQEIQNQLLLPLAKDADLLETFKDASVKQVDPILLDERGFVVNGNRRLAAWRQLLLEDVKKYGHFTYIDVVVLPYCDEKEIDRLEASYQIQKDIKADYTWDAKANMMLHKRKLHDFSDKEIGDLYGMKESDVREFFDMRAYAADYLHSRGKDNHWSVVSDDEFAFRKIVTSRARIASAGEQELFKQAAFTLIDDSTVVGGRLYEAIPNIQEHIAVIKDQLQAHFKVATAANDGDLATMFGGNAPVGSAIDIPLAVEIQKPENAEAARTIIVDVLESQKQIKKDVKNTYALVKYLADANARVGTAVSQCLKPESNTDGVEAQLAQLEAKIKQVRDWLSTHA
jgi:hypothetical protein